MAPEPRQITREEAWQITCHEAGHVVLAARHRIPFSHAERGDGDTGEVSVNVGPGEKPNQDEIRRWQQFYAGGAAAEKLLFGSYFENGSRNDRALHEELEGKRCPRRTGGWDQDVLDAANDLDRESVERIAKELGQRGRLGDEEVYELLGCPPPWY
jgi:hypothetical protein